MINSNYSWGEAFQLRLLSLLLKQPENCLSFIRPSYFTNPIFSQIASVLVETYRPNPSARLGKATLFALLKPRTKTLAEWRVQREYARKILRIDLSDSTILVSQAREFAKEQAYRDALIRAEKDITGRRYERAVQRLTELKALDEEEPDLGINYWKDLAKPSRYRSDRMEAIPTGFPLIDRAMQGGLALGELGVLLAPPKGGKSTVLANLAVSALRRGKTVLIATAEVSDRKYQHRIDSILTGVPPHKLYRLRKEVIRKLKRSRRLMKGNLYIKKYPTGKATTGDIENWVKEIEASYDTDVSLLIVDSAYLFQPQVRSKERRINIGQATVELRGIATERNIAVWNAAQTTRSGLSKEILRPEDFAEDISQAWTLDFLVALCQTKDEKKPNTVSGLESARLFIASARDTASGRTARISINRETYQMFQKEDTK